MYGIEGEKFSPIFSRMLLGGNLVTFSQRSPTKISKRKVFDSFKTYNLEFDTTDLDKLVLSNIAWHIIWSWWEAGISD